MSPTSCYRARNPHLERPTNFKRCGAIAVFFPTPFSKAVEEFEMTAWNYLSFNRHGDLKPGCVMPKDGEFVFGFCAEDHRVYLCYKEPGYGIAFLSPGRGLEDDMYVIAWARIDSPTMPDFAKFKRLKTLRPPILSMEAARNRVAYWKRVHKKQGVPKTKVEAKQRLDRLNRLEADVVRLKEECVEENGYHLPPAEMRLNRRRYEFAIPTSTL